MRQKYDKIEPLPIFLGGYLIPQRQKRGKNIVFVETIIIGDESYEEIFFTTSH